LANIPLLKTPKCSALHFGVIRILKFAEGNMTNQVSEVTSISSNQVRIMSAALRGGGSSIYRYVRHVSLANKKSVQIISIWRSQTKKSVQIKSVSD
jgi:hypothetical protein